MVAFAAFLVLGAATQGCGTIALAPVPTNVLNAVKERTFVEFGHGKFDDEGKYDAAGAAPVTSEVEGKARDRQAAVKAFNGVDLAVGFGVAFDFGGKPRVEEATVQNGIVRVTKKSDIAPRVMFELHNFFLPNSSFFGLRPPGEWGFGPFLSIQSSTDEILDSLGVGLMLGFKAPDELSQSLNVGIGVFFDRSATVLGSGFRDGMSVPSTVTTVPLKEVDKQGILLFFSFSF